MIRGLLAIARFTDRALEWLLFDVLFNRRWRGLVVALAAVGLLVVALRSGPTAATTDQGLAPCDERLLAERPWIDKKPQNIKDQFSLYFFGRHEIDEGWLVGVHLSGTPVKYQTEYFGYRMKRGKVCFWFPADDSKACSDFGISRERHGRFDLKLVLQSDPRHKDRPYTYFGRTDGKLDIPRIEQELANLDPKKLTRDEE